MCKCDCGKEKEAAGNALISGDIKSCGCLHSWREVEFLSLLSENNIRYIKEQTFEGLTSAAGVKLRFDFGIYRGDSLCCLIEYQGEQHYDINNNWCTQKLREHDHMKKEYCLKNNIPLYCLNKETNFENFVKEMKEAYGL